QTESEIAPRPFQLAGDEARRLPAAVGEHDWSHRGAEAEQIERVVAGCRLAVACGWRAEGAAHGDRRALQRPEDGPRLGAAAPPVPHTQMRRGARSRRPPPARR